MQIYGYHRTSTKEQHLDRGIQEIERYCNEHEMALTNIFTDQETGKNFNRPRYTVLVEDVLRPGDILIVTELDRLGRNKYDTMQQIQRIKNMGVRLMVLELPTTLMDLSVMDNAMARMMLETINNMMLELYASMAQAELEKKELLQLLKGKDNVTLDGKKIMLYANIGNIKDLATVIQNDAGGIGLFRSEFIYLEKDRYPTEEEQFSIYKTAVETMAGKRVIIRTLDIGADKQCEYFKMDKEENPALGYRAIRICLTRPEIFKTQLRALFRASAYGNLAIMYPMITSLWEVKRIKEIVEEVKAELTAEQLEFGNPQQGIMIETPAAAIISDELAKEVDFFSIGTNDLTQYTLAIDRQNEALDAFYNPHHEAILRMIRMVIDNGHKENCWVGICGELGSDTALTKQFIEMGIDELSVSPAYILTIRNLIRELP